VCCLLAWKGWEAERDWDMGGFLRICWELGAASLCYFGTKSAATVHEGWGKENTNTKAYRAGDVTLHIL
jgi:hypothetical protein